MVLQRLCLSRALDSASRLLTAVSAPQATDLDRIKMNLLRVRFEEQMRTEQRKTPERLFSAAMGV